MGEESADGNLDSPDGYSPYTEVQGQRAEGVRFIGGAGKVVFEALLLGALPSKKLSGGIPSETRGRQIRKVGSGTQLTGRPLGPL